MPAGKKKEKKAKRMDLKITLTEAQEDALRRSNEASNTDAETRPSLDVFTASVASDHFDAHVERWAGIDSRALKGKIANVADRLTPEDREAIAAIAAKYEG